MSKIMTTQEIRKLVSNQLKKTEALMRQEMTSEVPLAELVMAYAIGNGGKRFRPMLTLLSAGLCDYEDECVITAAAFIEFIHNATLLHDDVVDESDMRRGEASANVAFGNAASVLVGDFLYTRAFQLMVRTNNMRLLSVMSEATNLIASGEVMQLNNIHNPNVDENQYYRVIELKTAVLFSAACQAAGILAAVSDDKINALYEYGRKLGMAFQIIDDLLDYTGDETKIGKALGDDLAEGKPTLPLIRAMDQLPPKESNRLREIIENGDREAINEVIDLLAQTDAIDYSIKAAQAISEEAVNVLSIFDDNIYKQALIALAKQASQRLM